MSHIPSRREFLATTSLALAGSTFRTRGFRAHVLPARVAYSPVPAAALMPASFAPLELRTFAMFAIDAANSAGANYADVRVAEQHVLELAIQGTGVMPVYVTIAPQFLYGIRVLVNGAWAFVHGTVPSGDDIAAAARNAVVTARGYAWPSIAPVEFSLAPAATGVWETPIQLDPFTVPLGDQTALMNACANAAARVRNGVANDLTAFRWIRETRVFASTHGTLTTQTFHHSDPAVMSGGYVLKAGVEPIWIPVLGPTSGGYECVTMPQLQDDLKRAAEEAAWLASLPRRTLDVGRYPVVLDGTTFGMLLGRTLGVALELDRVLGYEAGAGGTSFLGPPHERLGTPVASSLLNVTASRNLPSITAVKWDDEGIETRPYPLIMEGRLKNYHTSCQTAAALAVPGQLARSNGCAVAPYAASPVLVRTPHLTVAPASVRATVADLCKDILHGVFVCYGHHVAVDQQLASGHTTWGSLMFEIEKGKIVRRLRFNGLQFGTSRFWKSLIGVGDASTVCSTAIRLWKGDPEATAWHSGRAPAGLFKDVDIISMGIPR